MKTLNDMAFRRSTLDLTCRRISYIENLLRKTNKNLKNYVKGDAYLV